MRIAHYNISQGGQNRTDKLKEVIKDINPDVLGILEAVDWNKEKEETKELVKELGFKYFEIAKAPKHNIAILSNEPISVNVINRNIKHVVLQAELVNLNICLFFIHLSPVSEEDRLTELDEILFHSKNYSRVIIMGDFNSLSRSDPYDKEFILQSLLEKGIKKYGENYLRFDVIDKLEKEKYIDIAKYFKKDHINTVPTLFNVDANHQVPLRIDYIFSSKSLLPYIRNIEVLKNNNSDFASDHYPFYIDLDK